MFLSEIDEQVLKVVIRLVPCWVHQIEKDIASHPNAPSRLNDSLQNNEVVDDTVIDITDGDDISHQCDSESGLNSTNDFNNILSQMQSLTKEMQQLKRERETERTLMLEMWNIIMIQNCYVTSNDSANAKLKSNESKEESSQDNESSVNGNFSQTATKSDSMSISKHELIQNFHSKIKTFCETSTNSGFS